jgi:two-component system, cell cycle sensor histidine kinase and response regulator CckA
MTIKTLVVDNNPVHLKAISSLLEQERCQVKTAGNGLEALEILNDYHPDIIFTDLIMPLVGGEQLCKIIRSSMKLKDIFLVILSAIILEDRERILAELDYDICIVKGNLKELRNHLQETLAMFTHKVRKFSIILGDSAAERARENESGSIVGELLSEKYHLNEILGNLNEGIVELSPQGKIVSLNRAATKILDRDMEGLIGVAFSSLSWGDHLEKVRIWSHHELKLKGGRALEITETDPIRMRDRILSASFLPVQENGNVFAVCILRDITRQYNAEQYKREFDNAIRLVKKMDSMSCMAGGMAHDFNNLLTVICGNLDMMNLSSISGDVYENGILLESARKAAYLTVDLTRKISCFSPFGIINREDVIIEELVTATVAEFFSKTPERYSCRTGKKKNIVNIDREQIAEALSNVLQNAVEAGATGEISISINDETFDAPSIKAGQYVPEGNFVKISIGDNGKGIENENLLKVFDPYYSTKQRGSIKGMGLGLTIVYSTLRNHGGYVVIESEPGEGTVVSFFLPLYRSLTDQELVSRKAQKRQILFMEHDEQLRIIGKIMLEYLGFETLTATCKEEALKEVERGVEQKNPVAMVILNLLGTGGSDGVEICRALHSLDPDLRVVVSSGALLEPVMKNYKGYGFVNTLPKPYTLDDLKRITSVL